MKKRINFILIIVFILGFSIQVNAQEEILFFWEKYEMTPNYLIEWARWRSSTFNIERHIESHGNSNEWILNVDRKTRDIICTKTNTIINLTSQIEQGIYKVGEYIETGYFIIEDTDFKNSIGVLSPGDTFNYSEAIRQGNTINLRKWTGVLNKDDYYGGHKLGQNFEITLRTKELGKFKGDFIGLVSSYNRTEYPDDGERNDYWYNYSHFLDLKAPPELSIYEPIENSRVGEQDNLIISGSVKDKNIGNIIDIKYSMGSMANSNITLTQPMSLIANGQEQSFKGYIRFQNLVSGNNTLELWAEDNTGLISNTISIKIMVFNTLENIVNTLKGYVYSDNVRFLIINSNTRIAQNAENDRLISSIRTELSNKNVRLFFIGQDKETEQYIKSKLSLN